MSRTHKTAPAWIRAWRYGWLVADHDHRSGAPCDLPAPSPDPLAAGTRCAWAIGPAFAWARHGRCGCATCNESLARRAARRRERRAVRRDLRRPT